MKNAKGVIEKRLSLLSSQFSSDKKIVKALVRVSENVYTAADIEYINIYFKQLYLRSSLTGYIAQSQLVNMPLSKYGTSESVKFAKAKADELTAKLEANLPGKRELVPNLRTFIADSAPKEGLATGQGFSAQENKLDFKIWIRTGPDRVGPSRAHSKLEGKTIPRTAKFTLPDGQKVDGPHDWNIRNPAAEWVNCHHSIVYVPSATSSDLSR